jgi:hypothetical protein
MLRRAYICVLVMLMMLALALVPQARADGNPMTYDFHLSADISGDANTTITGDFYVPLAEGTSVFPPVPVPSSMLSFTPSDTVLYNYDGDSNELSLYTADLADSDCLAFSLMNVVLPAGLNGPVADNTNLMLYVFDVGPNGLTPLIVSNVSASIAPVPLPPSLLLLGSGLLGLVGTRLRQRRARS